MSGGEPPALWEEALDGPPGGEDAQVTQWLDELWKKHKDDIPWNDSPPGSQ